MKMEDVRELKDVLERVEERIIAAGKVYSAMNFAFWLTVMMVYYVLEGVVNMRGKASAVYWGGAILLGIPLTIRIWRRLERLCAAFHPGARRAGRGIATQIALAWILGSVIGFFIIPSMASVGVSPDARFATGLLSFISIAILSQWLLTTAGRGEFEMIPAFLLPALAIPVVWHMESGAIIWAGFVIATGFSVTILWYLYSAFKAIAR
ncbi:hypothetical protein [Thermococcus sp.]|uniref:hypothetical protein n=1 Tax=Thermococcus sp. TaxID=35749 RepID=UPI0025DD2CF2|nr:hypothetical protein [Thermococcus sp.]